MADVASGSDLDINEPTDAEKAALAIKPPDASETDADLDAKINDIAGGVLGMGNLNDPRFVRKAADDDSAASGTDKTGDGSDDGGDGQNTLDSNGADAAAIAKAAEDKAAADAAETEAAAERQRVEQEARDAASDKDAEQRRKAEAKDYTLTVKAADTTDANGTVTQGKEYKIEKIEDLPEDFIPRNNRQILEIIDNLHKLEATKAKDEAANEVAETTKAEATARKEMLSSWDKEIEGLQKEGLIEQPKLKPTDPKYLEDPAMKKVADVFEFMEKTNNARKAAGNPNLIRSFADAFDKLELVELKATRDKAAKDEVETAKLKAGVQGGGKSGTSGGKPQVYVAGAAGGEISNML